ncbi:MAG: glycosyltransferase family 2 protein [Candidatus Coatesbacteria bacterium]|nr:glycosyltransferase family 2 protein [Candidatus Coatesbacteria bacterium]
MNETAPEISIVIPMKDEAATIGAVIDAITHAMKGLEGKYEIIAVDDGSVDGSADLALKSGARVVSHEAGKGYGAALKTGIDNALYGIIVIIDGDGTYPPERIPDIIDGLSSADMVVGARLNAGAAVPVMRRPAKWFLTKLASFLSGFNILDLNSGLRAFRRDVALSYLGVLPDRFSFTSTITLLMIGDRLKIKYIPIDYYKREGRSKIVPSDAFSFLVLIIRTIMFFNPLKIFFPVGLVLLILGGGKLLTDYIIYDRLSGTPILFILTAIQLWGLGFLAELLLFLERRRK